MKAVGATESADVADFLRDTELFPETRVSDEDLTELASKLVVVRAGPGMSSSLLGTTRRARSSCVRGAPR